MQNIPSGATWEQHRPEEFVISSTQVTAGYLQVCSTTEDMMVLGLDPWSILPQGTKGANRFLGLKGSWNGTTEDRSSGNTSLGKYMHSNLYRYTL